MACSGVELKKTSEGWQILAGLGLRRLHLGVETGDEDLYRLLGKPGSPTRLVDGLSRLKGAGISVSLILLAGAGSIWIYFFVLSLLPQGQSVVETPGLSANVSVVRDRHGVPGIIGEKEEVTNLWVYDDLAHLQRVLDTCAKSPEFTEAANLLRSLISYEATKIMVPTPLSPMK